jgi:hypothetical protein
MAVHHATIRIPDGRNFNLDIGDPWTRVHEIPAPRSVAHK